jgi:hypothetical protein
MASIPANQLVTVNAGVVGTGGSPLSLNSVFLTNSALVPIGAVMPFYLPSDVAGYFGTSSIEAQLANVYFLGFDNSNIKPGTLYFSQYNTAAVGAWLRGASQKSMTLAQLKALSGTLSVTLDGALKTSSSINLSAATSFSNAAVIISTALGATVTYNAMMSTFTLASSTTGAGSTIDYASGNIADSLGLSKTTGAVLSQGAVPTTPAQAMASVAATNQNWVCFMSTFEPVLADKLAFAAWTNAQNQRYAYVCWDTDISATQAGNASSFGVQISALQSDGIVPVYLDPNVAAFICGATASIDFTQTNGRITYAYKGQSGLATTVSDAATANNLIANGYNFYGAYATPNTNFNLLQPGQMPGKWKWIDAYINQVYLNAQLQLAILSLFQAAKSVPYNVEGYTLMRAACGDPITQALNFGAIKTGIPLSQQQGALINQAAGLDIVSTINQAGYYLQIKPATAQVRGLRQSPPMTLWYTDGGSIHRANLASLDVM